MRLRAISSVVSTAFLGLAVGVGGYTFIYARGYSYMLDSPEACANCHVMREHLDGWVHSSHRRAATCNDCHTPQGFLARYLVKAENGFWHSYAFTSGRFQEPIRIRPQNREVTEAACRRCHQEIVQAVDGRLPEQSRSGCVRCHGAVGHPRP